MCLLQGCLNQSQPHLDPICRTQDSGGVTRTSPFVGDGTSAQAQGPCADIIRAPLGKVSHFSVKIINLLFSLTLQLFLLKMASSEILFLHSLKVSLLAWQENTYRGAARGHRPWETLS